MLRRLVPGGSRHGDVVHHDSEQDGRETSVLGDEAALVPTTTDDPGVCVRHGLAGFTTPVFATGVRLLEPEDADSLLDARRPVVGEVEKGGDVLLGVEQPAVGDDHEAVSDAGRSDHEYELVGHLDRTNQHHPAVAGETAHLLRVLEVVVRLLAREFRGLERRKAERGRSHDDSIAKIQRSLYQACLLYNLLYNL